MGEELNRNFLREYKWKKMHIKMLSIINNQRDAYQNNVIAAHTTERGTHQSEPVLAWIQRKEISLTAGWNVHWCFFFVSRAMSGSGLLVCFKDDSGARDPTRINYNKACVLFPLLSL